MYVCTSRREVRCVHKNSRPSVIADLEGGFTFACLVDENEESDDDELYEEEIVDEDADFDEESDEEDLEITLVLKPGLVPSWG